MNFDKQMPSMQAMVSNCGNFIVLVAFYDNSRVEAIDVGDGWMQVDTFPNTAMWILASSLCLEKKSNMTLAERCEILFAPIIGAEGLRSDFWNFHKS